MAIEFNCPYCAVAIRVPDSAGGKQGKCPSCAKRLLVPQVAAGAVAEASPAEAFPSFGGGGHPVAPSAPAEGAFGELPFGGPAAPAARPTQQTPHTAAPHLAHPAAPAAFDPLAMQATPPEPSFPTEPGEGAFQDNRGARYARTANRRRRQRSNLIGKIAVPGVVILIVVAGAIVFTWKSEAKLEGNLEAVAFPTEPELPSKYLKPETYGVDADVSKSVLEAMEGQTAVLASHSMKVRFRGDPKKGFEITLEPGIQSRFVRVDLRQNELLARYCTRQDESFDVPRMKELKDAVGRFFAEREAALKASKKAPDASSYRDPLGLAALTGGTGYVIEAVVSNSAYRCVYEDDKGRLYFLLPRAATSFVLMGRKIGEAPPKFAGRYVCHVELAPEDPSAKPKASKPAEETMEEEVDGLAPKKRPGKKPEKPESEEMMESPK